MKCIIIAVIEMNSFIPQIVIKCNPFFKRFYLFLEREEGKEEEREGNIDVREKHQLVASCMCPEWGPDRNPGMCPESGIEPLTHRFAGQYPTN